MQKLGVFWKIQDICYIMGTEIFKIEEEMTEKMKPKVANPPSKNGQNSLLSIYIDWSSQPCFRALWSLNLTHQAKGTKLPLLYLLPMCGTGFAFIASHENAEGHQRDNQFKILPPIIRGAATTIRGKLRWNNIKIYFKLYFHSRQGSPKLKTLAFLLKNEYLNFCL